MHLVGYFHTSITVHRFMSVKSFIAFMNNATCFHSYYGPSSGMDIYLKHKCVCKYVLNIIHAWLWSIRRTETCSIIHERNEGLLAKCDTINTVILKYHDMTGMNSIEILLVLKLWFKRAFKSIGTIVTSCHGAVFVPRSEDARSDGSNCKRRAFSSEITSFGRCYGHSLALCVLAFNNTVCTKWNAAPRSTARSRKFRPICDVRDLDWFLGAFAWSRTALTSCVLSFRFLSGCP